MTRSLRREVRLPVEPFGHRQLERAQCYAILRDPPLSLVSWRFDAKSESHFHVSQSKTARCSGRASTTSPPTSQSILLRRRLSLSCSFALLFPTYFPCTSPRFLKSLVACKSLNTTLIHAFVFYLHHTALFMKCSHPSGSTSDAWHERDERRAMKVCLSGQR